MSIRNRTTFALIVASIALPGCGGGGGSGTTPPGLATPSTTVSDPVGDTNPVGGTLWDITQVNIPHVAVGATTLTVTTTFNQTVAVSDLPIGGAFLTDPSQLGVTLVLSGAGGAIPRTIPCLVSDVLNDVDFIVDGGEFGGPRLADGNFAVLDSSLTWTGGEASISFPTPKSIQYQIPRTFIAGATKVAVIANNGNHVTDCAPDNNYITF